MMTEYGKKCEKCGQVYFSVPVCCLPIYVPPEHIFGGQPRYGNVGKSLFPQGRPHPLSKKKDALT
jgi:hypothetical protein